MRFFLSSSLSRKLTWGLAMASFVGGAAILSVTGEDAGSAEGKPVDGKAEKPVATAEESKAAEKEKTDGAAKSAKTESTEHAASGSSERAPSGATDDIEEEAAFDEDARTGAGQLPEPAAIEDMKKQRVMLKAKGKELDSREGELKAKEQALLQEMQKLEALRDEISKIDGARKKENDGKVVKLVETVETMSPKAAAAMIVQLDEQLAVATMAKMSTPKLAKVLNIMEPAKSSRLSELLAGVIRSKAVPVSGQGTRVPASNGAEAAAPKAAAPPSAAAPTAAKGGNASKEGGDKNDGQSK